MDAINIYYIYANARFDDLDLDARSLGWQRQKKSDLHALTLSN